MCNYVFNVVLTVNGVLIYSNYRLRLTIPTNIISWTVELAVVCFSCTDMVLLFLTQESTDAHQN